jgi:hypothetical protein
MKNFHHPASSEIFSPQGGIPAVKKARLGESPRRALQHAEGGAAADGRHHSSFKRNSASTQIVRSAASGR